MHTEYDSYERDEARQECEACKKKFPEEDVKEFTYLFNEITHAMGDRRNYCNACYYSEAKRQYRLIKIAILMVIGIGMIFIPIGRIITTGIISQDESRILKILGVVISLFIVFAIWSRKTVKEAQGFLKKKSTGEIKI